MTPAGPAAVPRRRLIALASAMTLAGCAGGIFNPRDPGPTLTDALDAVVDTPPVDQVLWGILAVDVGTGQVLYARNARRKFVPASNAKILVTAAALLEWGPDSRFRTEIWQAGESAEGGVVEGDLVILGEGDPTLSRRFWEDDEAPLRALVDSVRAAGVTRITGRLVADVSAWDTVPTPDSWMVGNIPWGFSAAGAPFAISEGTTWIAVRGTAPGEPAEVGWLPGGTPRFVDASVTTVPPADSLARLEVGWSDADGRLMVRGSIRPGEVDTLPASTRLPAREAVVRLAQLLDSAGIAVAGGAAVVPDTGRALAGDCAAGRVPQCPGARRLAILLSPPMAEVVRGILEPSQNWMTEQLVRAMGVRLQGEGSWTAGLEAVSRTLVREAGVDSLDLALRDGSGLSAYNLVTPRALVSVLLRMRRDPAAADWMEALAAPGEEGSTLERRLLDLQGRVQAKTGTISNVNSLSGYLETDSGRQVAFAILTNGSGLPSATVRDRIDDVVRVLARVRPSP